LPGLASIHDPPDLLISASQVARITGVNHWHLACGCFRRKNEKRKEGCIEKPFG
jgi:hypothetical protein